MKTRLLLSLMLVANASLAASLSDQLTQTEQTLNTNPDLASELLPKLAAQYEAMDSDQRYQFDWLQRRFGFQLEDVEIDRDQDQADVCLRFNRAVQPQPLQDWATKVSVTPVPDGGLRYADNALCFTGSWANSYQLKIDASLQSDNRVALGNAIEREIATGNRNPMLRFASPGRLLAMGGEDRIALESTNVSTVRLELWQFPREGLSNDELRRALTNPQSYWADFKENDWLRGRASNIFSGSFTVDSGPANSTAQSIVRFQHLFGDNKPDTNAFYLLNAWDNSSGEDYADNVQTLAFTQGKAGLSAYQTAEGLWVEVRDLVSTHPVAGLEVALYAKSGALIGKASSDNKGMAVFSRAQISGKDGDMPSYLLASSEKLIGEQSYGITWLDLEDYGFDLADKGLQGDEDSGALRHWSWLDRGIYRPGETVHALWVVKNRDLSPYTTPLWLTVQRPDGVALVNRSIEADASGAYHMDYDVASDAALGNWQVSLRLGRDGDVVASDEVRIDSIMPQTLEAKAKPASPLRAGQENRYQVQADWLYGAPASDIDVQASYRRGVRTSAIPGYENWQIGRHDEEERASYESLESVKTNASGEALFSFSLPAANTTRPQEVRFDASIMPQGGRPLDVRATDVIQRDAPYVAMNLEGDSAKVALVHDNGDARDATLNWTLYNVTYNYYWYRQDDRWYLRDNATRLKAESGTVQASAREGAIIPIPAGSEYSSRVLEVTTDNPLSAASVPVGYQPGADSVAPDRIRFANNDHAPYRKGDTVNMRLFAPFDGVGSVHLATDGIVDTIPVTFADGVADIRFSWENWDGGVWLLASGYNADQSGARNRRAVGLTWLGADTSAHRLELAGDIPETIQPGGELTLTFKGEGWVNVAVIDDGLYQLGRATFADPLNAFFGKKRLPLSLFDVWGSVIRQLGGDPVALRSGAGGDEEDLSGAMMDLPDVDMRNFIRYWSNPVAMENGEATIRVPIPEAFNGRLRVMAANYDNARFGHLEKTLTVRAPLVTELRTPTYLSVKDQGEFLLRLHNTTSAPQTLKLNATAGLIALSNGEQELTLAADESKLLALPFTAEKAGDDEIQVRIQSGERSYALDRALTVRSETLPRYVTRYAAIAPGKKLNIDVPARSVISPSASLPWSADSLAEELRRYPYTCSEQLTSRLTVLRDDARRAPEDADKQAAFRDAWNTLLNRQFRDGSFSLWRGGSGELWLSAYAGETLLSEGEAPFASGTPQDRLLQYLRKSVLLTRSEQEFQDELSGIAYAHLLLARNGMDLRGALINDSERLPNVLPLSPTTLNFALAFAAYGDGERGAALLGRVDTGLNDSTYNRYGNRMAADGELLVRLAEWQKAMPDQSAQLPAWQDSIIKRLADASHRYLSTQTSNWLLRAAPLYDSRSERVTANGQALNARMEIATDSSVSLDNPGKVRQYVAVSEVVYPPADKAESSAWTLGLRYENFAGQAVNLASVPLHENILVHVDMKRTYGEEGDIILTCALPAGVSASTNSDNSLSGLGAGDWYDNITWPQMEEIRDDRHIAAFRLSAGEESISHTFAMKAVRAGTWHAAGCLVEDMYQPQHFARDKAQVITINAK